MSATSPATDIPAWQFDRWVEAEADGTATAEQLAALEADRARWQHTLWNLLRDLDAALADVRRSGASAQIVADLESELRTLSDAWGRLTGEVDDEDEWEDEDDVDGTAPNDEASLEPGTVALQVSWEPGHVVAWASGRNADVADVELITEMLAASGAPAAEFVKHEPVTLPGGVKAPALAIPVGDVAGWLVAAGAGHAGDDIGPSLLWLGRVALWAVELTAKGAMVPVLSRRKTRRKSGANNNDNKGENKSGSFSVRWTPALVDPHRLKTMADEMPGAILASEPESDPRSVVRSALTGVVNAICRDAARRIEVPAPPPQTRTPSDVAEAMLSRLDGSSFTAPLRVADSVLAKVEKWANPVVKEHEHLVIQLDPPDSSNAWHLSVLAPGRKHQLRTIAEAMADTGPKGGPAEQMLRLERLYDPLLRPGGDRRGQVYLSQNEAWELMTTTGPMLEAAGFELRVPALSRKKATASLRLFADASSPSAAGANQLANVSWSAMFDDVELSAEDIARLAKEARPLIHTKGRWVALDRADLAEAAAALAERKDQTQLSGAEMLRLALGLDGSPLAGGVSLGGDSWASDLLRRAATTKAEPADAPDGFVGELRTYQADALAWLKFLDIAGLGGCLALDMGLGKTPTMLAHLQGGAGNGPALVIAPPAVVGNWAAEAARFTPNLRVVVHHGATRASADEIAAEVAVADVVITTYGTAVRDVDAISAVEWDCLVLDEAQAIKNPANDTSQQLRRFNARTRIALTGTPIENGLGDLWAILDFTNPGLVGPRPEFIAHLSSDGGAGRVEGEDALRAMNGILVFRRTKAEPEIAAELPDRIDELDHCAMTPEQVGLYQAVLDKLVIGLDDEGSPSQDKGAILAAITALKQICNHPTAYQRDDGALDGRSGKLARLEEIVDAVFAADERVLVFTHFAEWGVRLAEHLQARTGTPVACYHGGLSRGARDKLIEEFQSREGPGALVLSLKAGGTGLNLTAASHVVLYDRWWNPAVEDQARDRAWRIGQTRTVVCHRLICPGTVDERVEEVVAGKRKIADLVLPKSSSLADLDSNQLRTALGIRPGEMLTEDFAVEAANEAGGDAGDGQPPLGLDDLADAGVTA